MQKNNQESSSLLKKTSKDKFNRISKQKMGYEEIDSIVSTNKQKNKQYLNELGYCVNADGSKVEIEDAKYILFEMEDCRTKDDIQIFGWHNRTSLDEEFDFSDVSWGGIEYFKRVVINNIQCSIGLLKFDTFRDKYIFLKELSTIAMQEDWSFGDTDSVMVWPGLEYYIKHTTSRLIHENNTHKAQTASLSKDVRYILLNTMLKNQRGEYILIYGEVKPHGGKVGPIRHPHICFQSSKGLKTKFTTDDIQAILQSKIDDMEYSIHSDWEIDKTAKVQKEQSYSRMIYNRHQKFCNGNRIPDAVLSDIYYVDDTLAIPIFNPHVREIQIAIPIYWKGTHCKTYSYALSLVPDEKKKKYIPDTIWSLEAAYLNARLIVQPKAEWLSVENINKQKHM